jgi:hypothetical protein
MMRGERVEILLGLACWSDDGVVVPSFLVVADRRGESGDRAPGEPGRGAAGGGRGGGSRSSESGRRGRAVVEPRRGPARVGVAAGVVGAVAGFFLIPVVGALIGWPASVRAEPRGTATPVPARVHEGGIRARAGSRCSSLRCAMIAPGAAVLDVPAPADSRAGSPPTPPPLPWHGEVDPARLRDERLVHPGADADHTRRPPRERAERRYATGATAMPPAAMSTFVCAVVPAEGTPTFEHGTDATRDARTFADARGEFFDDPMAEARVGARGHGDGRARRGPYGIGPTAWDARVPRTNGGRMRARGFGAGQQAPRARRSEDWFPGQRTDDGQLARERHRPGVQEREIAAMVT